MACRERVEREKAFVFSIDNAKRHTKTQIRLSPGLLIAGALLKLVPLHKLLYSTMYSLKKVLKEREQ